MTELLCQRGQASANDLGDSWRLIYSIDVPGVLLERCMGEAKSGISCQERSIGIVGTSPTTLKIKNLSTTTVFETEDGAFLRAFLMPGMCVDVFRHSTH